VCSVFDKLCTRHRAVEGRAAVWKIAKCSACVRRPLLSVGLIAQQRHGSVRWGGWAGHEPTARTNCHRLPKAQKPFYSLRRDHSGSGDQSELPVQVSTASVMSAAPFDRCHCRRITRLTVLPTPFDCLRLPCDKKGASWSQTRIE